MMTSPTTSPPPSPLARVWRVVAGTIIAASFGVWVYAYSGLADRPPPDLFADPDLGARAEAICAAAVADVEGLPGALHATDGADRADQVNRATDRYEAMVDQLSLLEVVEAADRVIVDGWLGDWRVLMEDRRRYAEEVAEDPGATFLLTKVADNERLDRRLIRLAGTNSMPSCSAPTDV